MDIVGKYMKLAGELREKRVMVSGNGLQGVATATSVRATGGTQSPHDGPFAETQEQLGGYYLVDVPDLDAALAYARRTPVVDGGMVEVRSVKQH